VGAEGDVLADGQAQDAVRGRELEAVDGGVVGDFSLFGEREFLEFIRVEDFLRF